MLPSTVPESAQHNAPPLRVFMRSVYGKASVYISPDDSRRDAIRLLTGCETLRDSDVRALHSLGFTFQHVPDPKTAQFSSALFSRNGGAS